MSDPFNRDFDFYDNPVNHRRDIGINPSQPGALSKKS